MHTLTDHPITQLWPPRQPDVLQLYSFPTPNGVKISIALEEMGVPYEAHTVKISGDQHTDAFRSLNPNAKIPAIIDPNGPEGTTVALWESGAILLYLAEKTGQLMPRNPADRFATMQWLMFQMGGLGPMIGQYGYFAVFAGKEIEDPRPLAKFVTECKRLLAVLEGQFKKHEFVQGDEYTIADIAIFPWLRGARDVYKAGDAFEMDSFIHTMAYLERCLARPAVQRGLLIPPRQ